MIDFNSTYNLTKNFQILYIEDDANFREETADFFRDIFSSVDIAMNGEEGLDKYTNYLEQTNNYYDIVITDINMPHMDGIELINKVYEINPQQLIIVISAHNTPDNLLDLVNMGIEQFLLKPIQYENMLKTFYESANKITQKRVEKKDIKCIELSENYTFDLETEQLLYRENIVKLTKKEHLLIKLFIKNNSKVSSFQEIFFLLWPEEAHLSSQETLKPIISRLRKKIPENKIDNIYGVGYKLHF